MQAVIRVGRVVPSLNELKREYRNPHAYARLREGWRHDIHVLLGIRNTKLIKAHVDMHHRCELLIISYRRRVLDKDNLYGGVKPIVDAIRDLDLIVDDSPQWLDLTVDQERTAELTCTSIVFRYDNRREQKSEHD
jgi:hypothetical protein